MEIEIVSCEKVKPYTPTPSHLQIYKLCMLDQLYPPSLVSAVLFYANTTTSADQTQTTEHLKTSLSHTLTRFYPVAGRGSGDNESILCNDEGVAFYVAKEKGGLTLSDLLARDYKTNALLPCPIGMHVEWGLESNVAMIQVTHFGCGGVAVGVVFWHKLGDAASVANFLKDWATTCTSSPPVAGPDFNIPQSLFPPKQALRDVSISLGDYVNKGAKYLLRRYVFDDFTIQRLKDEASNMIDSPTGVEVVTTLLWKCYMVASLANDKQTSTILHAVNLRRPARHPPIPFASFGNLLAVTAGSSNNIGDMTSGPELVKQTRDIIRKVDDEYVKRMCGDQGLTGFYENRKYTFGGMGEASDCLFFSSWCGMGFYDVDFGWGKPVWIKNTTLTDSESSVMNTACLIDTKHGNGSIEACLLMEEKYVHAFDNIQLLQEYQVGHNQHNKLN